MSWSASIIGYSSQNRFDQQNEREKTMSHHLDSPIARQDIRLDITDLYVFRGETGTVFVINVCHSIAGPVSAPGYHPKACTNSGSTSMATPSRM
jgi:hypothetical protein